MKAIAGITGVDTNINYNYRYEPKNLLKIAAIQFALIFLFLFLFRPFGVNEAEQRFSYTVTCLFHALVPICLFYIYFTCLNFFSKERPLQNRWTFNRELIHLAVLFLIIGTCGFFMRRLLYTNPGTMAWRYLWEEIRNTYLAGSLLSAYIIFANYYSASKAKEIALRPPTVTDNISQKDKTADPIFIKANIKSDDFSFNPDAFVFAKADGNYVEFFIDKNGSLEKELKRISLTSLEDQLSGHPNFIKCHRTYLVNTNHVVKISGNAQGYLISFNGTTDKIPVSRVNIPRFDKLFNQLNKPVR
ncbi:MAG: LytTR family DNA-binding domain-containing protein [Bacteroidota bacterium]